MNARTVQNIWKDDVDSEFLCRMKKTLIKDLHKSEYTKSNLNDQSD